MDRAPFLARGDHPDTPTHRRRSPAQPAQPARRQDVSFTIDTLPAPAPSPASRPIQPSPSYHCQPDTERRVFFCCPPPCQLTRPVVDAPNLEAPCPLTGYSRGSVRCRLARGLMRWDGLGCSLSLLCPLVTLSGVSLCMQQVAVNEEERQKNTDQGSKTPLASSAASPAPLSYKHSNFQTFFLPWTSWARCLLSIVFN